MIKTCHNFTYREFEAQNLIKDEATKEFQRELMSWINLSIIGMSPVVKASL
jgi:hypothetical protein